MDIRAIFRMVDVDKSGNISRTVRKTNQIIFIIISIYYILLYIYYDYIRMVDVDKSGNISRTVRRKNQRDHSDDYDTWGLR